MEDNTGNVFIDCVPFVFLISERYPYRIPLFLSILLPSATKMAKLSEHLATFSSYSSIAVSSHLGKLCSAVIHR